MPLPVRGVQNRKHALVPDKNLEELLGGFLPIFGV